MKSELDWKHRHDTILASNVSEMSTISLGSGSRWMTSKWYIARAIHGGPRSALQLHPACHPRVAAHAGHGAVLEILRPIVCEQDVRLVAPDALDQQSIDFAVLPH